MLAKRPFCISFWWTKWFTRHQPSVPTWKRYVHVTDERKALQLSQPSLVWQVVWKNIHFIMWDLGGQDSLRAAWNTYYSNTEVRGSNDTCTVQWVATGVVCLSAYLGIKERIFGVRCSSNLHLIYSLWFSSWTRQTVIVFLYRVKSCIRCWPQKSWIRRPFWFLPTSRTLRVNIYWKMRH